MATIDRGNSIRDMPDYLVKEADHLRARYGELRRETRALETYTLTAVGVIWSWCAANGESTHSDYLVWLPVPVVLLFGIRALGISLLMSTVGSYLLRLESTFTDLPDELGWERFSRKDRAMTIWPFTAYAFWGSLSVLSVVAPFVLA